MVKTLYPFASLLAGCFLIALPFSGFGQRQDDPAVGRSQNQTISTLGGGKSNPNFILLAPAADLDQYRNGPFDAPVNTCTNWVNGNAGEQNSHYIEGWSIPYRCVMTDLPLNTPITLTLGYDIRHSSKNALDYLTYFHRLSPHDIFCDQTHDAPECVTPATGSFSTFPIPAPSSTGSPVPGMPTNSFNNLPAGERVMVLYGGTITNISYNTQGDLNASDAETTIDVTFTVAQSTATLAWGGHIASRLDWGEGNSAGGISGSPYHMRLKDWTLNNLGNQDRSLSAGAVGPQCFIMGPDSVCEGSNQQYCVTNQNGITYNWTVSGGDAVITGSNTGNCVEIQAGAGNYTVMVTLSTNDGFCSDCSINVIVEPIGVCVIGGENVVCPGATSQHCASPGGTSWSWSVSGGAIIVGPADQECVTVTASNSCDSSYTLSLSEGDPGCGSLCTKTVLIQDVTLPEITCPANTSVSCTTGVPAADVNTLVVSDNCGGAVTTSHVGDAISNQTCADRYTLTRTYQAKDACGNTATCNQVITVDDQIPPGMTCLADTSVSCTNQVPAVDINSVIVNDNCGGPVTISHVSDAIFNHLCADRYLLVRTYRATDACGNSATCSQKIIVNDQTPPSVTCTADVTVSCTSDVPAADVNALVVNDNCGGTVATTHVGDVISNQTCADRYTLTRTYRATDACGNSATCSQKITVNDQTPPSITCPANVTVSCASEVPAADVNTLTVSDNCGGPVATSHVGDAISNQTCADRYTLTRTYQAEDACGNTATCDQIITVDDQTPPSITCPANVTVSCASEVPATDVNALTVSDNCGGPVATSHVGDAISNQTCADRYTLTRTYQAADACGNTATCDQIITVDDQTSPSITCPDDATVSCTSEVPAADPNALVVSDNCGGAVTTTHVGDAISNQTCADRYTLTRTYQAEDACGNTATCDQIITVDDQIPPSVTCPDDVTVSCTSEVPAANPNALVVSDNCGGTVTTTHVGDAISNQTCADRYTLTRTYQAADACGNTATCDQIITVDDQIPPSITCPDDVTVSCTSEVPAADPNTLVVSDNCGGAVATTHVGDAISNQTCADRYTLTRTYMATDACDNTATCNQIITVDDQTPPSITCPPDTTVSCAIDVPTADINTLIVSDNCGGLVATSHVGDAISNQICADRYTLTRTYMATDACGNTATCDQVITVYDQTPPVITCPDPLTVTCADDVPAPDTSGIIAIDYGCSSCKAFCTYTQGGYGNAGGIHSNGLTTTQTLDILLQTGPIVVGGGNGNCGFQVAATQCVLDILPAGGSSDPLPQNYTLDCTQALNNTLAGQVITLQLNVRYNLEFNSGLNLGAAALTCVLTPGQIEELGLAETAAVNDLIALSNMFLASICNGNNYPNGFGGLLSNALSKINEFWDDCQQQPGGGNAPVVTFIGDIITNQTCINRYTITRTYQAEDACGNTATCDQIITVDDQTPPSIICPDDVTVSCTSEVPAADPNALVVSDNCGGAVTTTHVGDAISNQTCADRYTLTRTYQAEDACGNTATCDQVITVDDQTPPSVTCPANVTVSCTGEVPAADPNALAVSDNCGGAVTTTHVGDAIGNQTCADRYTLTRTYQAEDACGNTATCDQIITVDDQIPPSITCPANVTVSCASGVPATDVNTLTVSDNCSGPVTTSHVGDQISNQTCADRFTLTRTYKATDACGNSAVCSQKIEVNDQTPPTVTCPANVTVSCANQVPAADPGTLVVSDNCGGMVTTSHVGDQISNQTCADNYTLTRTYMAADACGNTSTCSQTITVDDQMAPTVEFIVNGIQGGEEARESCDEVALLLDRGTGSDPSQPLILTLTVSGTATSGADFSPIAASYTIPAGQDQLVIPISIVADLLPEGPETIAVALTNSCSCDKATDTLTILDFVPMKDTSLTISICNSGSGITLTANPLGGAAPFTYLWSTNETTPSIFTNPMVTTSYAVTIVDACKDTAVNIFLVQVLPLASFTDTIAFCPGDTVFIGGMAYTSVGTVKDTLPGSGGACDTLATYVLVSLLPAPSVVTLTCPNDITVDTDPALVTYDLPVASTDCPCPGIALQLTEGLPSGSVFPLGTTKVCYVAKDSCGNTASCCFNVTVIIPPELPCSEVTVGCMKFELMGISEDAQGNNTYRIRVTNNCANKLTYVAFSLPSGVVALAPPNNSIYTAPSGHEYSVRNPNFSPFYSIRFYSSIPGIASGQADLFEYTLPAVSNPATIHVIVRLQPKIFIEGYLFTANCIVEQEPKPLEEEADKLSNTSPKHIAVFPNPTSGSLFADLSDWRGEQVKVKVFDSRGQGVQQLALTADAVPQEIQLPKGLPNGLYFLEVVTENGAKQTLRFVIQH